MANVTLTTVIRNSATLPLLLKLTDKLVAKRALTSLRIVDKTKKADAAFEIRQQARFDGDTQTLIPHVDVDAVVVKDPKAFRGMKMEGYYHHSTNQRLFQNGTPFTIAVRNGGIIGLTSQDNRKFEIVFGSEECVIRVGRGGGPAISTHAASGISCGGKEWKLYTLSWTENQLFVTTHDTNVTFSATCPRMDAPLDVTAAALPQKCCDVIVTSAKPLDIISVEPSFKAHISYHTSLPAAVDGFEVVSTCDIVYIDIDGWTSLSNGAVPLVIGDSGEIGVLRRSGLIQSSKTEKEVHSSFLSRSKGIIDKAKALALGGIEVQTSLDKSVSVGREGLGAPVLFATLSEELAGNEDFIAAYKSLIEDGPVGAPLVSTAGDVLIYLDSLAVDPAAMKNFLNEVIEVLPTQERKQLHELLTRSLN